MSIRAGRTYFYKGCELFETFELHLGKKNENLERL